jgi:DNA modification methylase
MELQTRKVSDLIPYINNSRTHSEEQINQIISSIKEFGFTNPILLEEENGIIAGHGRLMAVKKMGWTEVPCVTIKGLTKTQIKALNIADNQIALNAGWDLDKLKLEIKGLDEDNFDLNILGFKQNLINDFLFEETLGLTEDDETPDAKQEAKSKQGDIFLLGNHRLMCGDSTNLSDIEKLTQKQKADMIFTDPPYNVAFNGRSGKFDVIKNDNLEESEFNNFIDTFLSNLELLNINTYYICCNWAFYGILQKKLKPKACIVWAKNVFGLGKGYRHQHEFILFDGFIDADIKNESDLWNIAKDSKYKHPTQKPVALSIRAMKNSSREGNIVLDLFGGSGSTLIGCEKLNRKCHVMELDPIYVDVIIERWQNFTGKEAIHEQTGKRYNEL